LHRPPSLARKVIEGEQVRSEYAFCVLRTGELFAPSALRQPVRLSPLVVLCVGSSGHPRPRGFFIFVEPLSVLHVNFQQGSASCMPDVPPTCSRTTIRWLRRPGDPLAGLSFFDPIFGLSVSAALFDWRMRAWRSPAAQVRDFSGSIGGTGDGTMVAVTIRTNAC